MKQLLAALILPAFIAYGCSKGDEARKAKSDTISVTVTTGMIADMVRNVGGDLVTVTALMGPGVDPHLYKASEGDIARLSNADIIFYNGLFLEGKMAEILGKIARRGRPTMAIAEKVDHGKLREPQDATGHPDPHLWFDMSLWSETVPAVVEGLSGVAPEHAAQFEANGAVYSEMLAGLHVWSKKMIATIPEERRVLITAHDAFGYFGDAYQIDVVGLQGISTQAEYGIRDVKRLVDIIVERGVKAVFVESSVPTKSIEAVVEGCRAQGHDVAIGGQLFSDAMGEAGTPEGEYRGMVRHNVTTITKALR